jgi:hypothetical protein
MSDAPQLTPDAPLGVTLSVAQWRAVLEQLAAGPYRVVGPLIAMIEQQANAEIARLQPPPRRANGAEEHADG